MKEKPRVLFLCTHNAARSQMAEALLRRLEPTAVHPLTLFEAQTGTDVDKPERR